MERLLKNVSEMRGGMRWETVIAPCCLSDVPSSDVSGLNLGPCRLIRPCRSSGFVVLLPKRFEPLDKCFQRSTASDCGQYLILSLCLWANKTVWFMTGKLFNSITRITCSIRSGGSVEQRVLATARVQIWLTTSEKRKNIKLCYLLLSTLVH